MGFESLADMYRPVQTNLDRIPSWLKAEMRILKTDSKNITVKRKTSFHMFRRAAARFVALLT
jgi:hypothetical protein